MLYYVCKEKYLGGHNMKQVHIGYHSFTNSGIVEAVANVLYKDDFNVELFGVDLWADELPDNYQIVDYGSIKN